MGFNSETELVRDDGLRQLESRPSLFSYLKKTHERRHFIRAQGKASSRAADKDRYLGGLWIILDPLLQVSVYAVIFGLILQVDRGMDNFIGFLTLGVTFFGFATKGLGTGSSLIQSSRSLITAFNFPKVSIALAKSYDQFLTSTVSALLAVVVSLLFQWGTPLSWAILLLVPLYIMVFVFSLGCMLIVARLTAFIPDLKSVVSLIQRALFFMSGVFFDVSRFDTHPSLQKVVEANPIYQFLMAVRACVLDGEVPSAGTWLYLSGWSFGLLIIGFIFFWQAEERYVHVR